MNAESKRKSKTESLKALVFEFCSLLLQAAIPSSPVKKMYQDLGICAQMLLEGLPELSELWPLKKKRQNLGIAETRYRVT